MADVKKVGAQIQAVRDEQTVLVGEGFFRSTGELAREVLAIEELDSIGTLRLC